MVPLALLTVCEEDTVPDAVLLTPDTEVPVAVLVLPGFIADLRPLKALAPLNLLVSAVRRGP